MWRLKWIQLIFSKKSLGRFPEPERSGDDEGTAGNHRKPRFMIGAVTAPRLKGRSKGSIDPLFSEASLGAQPLPSDASGIGGAGPGTGLEGPGDGPRVQNHGP